ncbi:hypothetical protein Bphy_3129 [Paraburkholderia phymatum STM815]|uniref:Uncharacterized protein n=1 Tax=Paraburkholderia phymatum (strain DSM 17167 / CIP 108236 / LMG 21445 / STM815) TaxID=391038 RepID=B2JRH0_PARP8|nr:hypothetical protein Bphy_3129 [Paraburkholderia phymatum STM815]
MTDNVRIRTSDAHLSSVIVSPKHLRDTRENHVAHINIGRKAARMAHVRSCQRNLPKNDMACVSFAACSFEHQFVLLRAKSNITTPAECAQNRRARAKKVLTFATFILALAR